MDKTWQKNLIAFLGMVAAVLGVAAYLRTDPPAAGAAIVNAAPLEKKIDSIAADLHSLRAENDVRRVARDKELSGLTENFNQKFILLMQGINRLDDRVYQMQHKKSARAFDAEEDGG